MNKMIWVNDTGYTLMIEPEGWAFGFAFIEGHSIPLPGKFHRGEQGWFNDVTGFVIPDHPCLI